jgi:hypothetical protein
MNEDNNPIPRKFRPFLKLHRPNLSSVPWQISNALNTAIKAIGSKIRIDKKYLIILDQSPLSLPVVDTNSLNCTLGNEVIGLTMENIVFLDCQKLRCRSPEETVAIVLEELVHCLMNVKDENLVKQIVVFLYPKADYDKSRGYHRREGA